MGYDLYPAVDPTYNFPPEVRAALATSLELRNTVIPMTTNTRNNLTGAELWDGRLILNTTTDRINRYDLGTVSWLEVSNLADVTAGDATLLSRINQLRTKNAIINSDFSVNQREFTSQTANGYCFDRWNFSKSGGTVTASAGVPAMGELPESSSAFLRVDTTGQSSAGDYAFIQQKIESVKTLSSKTVTVSFLAKANAGTPKVAVEFNQYFGSNGSPSATVLIYAGQVILSTTWTRYSVTVSIPSIAGKTLGSFPYDDNLSLNLWTSAGSTFNSRTGTLGIQTTTIDFWGVQLEEGTVATSYVQETYAENLSKCQRFFLRFGASYFATLAVWSATKASGILPTPVTMRDPQVFSYVAIGNMSLQSGASTFALTGIAGTGAKVPNGFGIEATVASGLTAGYAAALYISTNYLNVSSEL